jgi:hypothetical protein
MGTNFLRKFREVGIIMRSLVVRTPHRTVLVKPNKEDGVAESGHSYSTLAGKREGIGCLRRIGVNKKIMFK